MPRSFIQIKNKDSIYTISAYKNDNCKRTKKRDTLFGNLRSWKKSQGQTTKKYYFSFFGDRFGILGEFPLRIWLCDPHGTCRF